MSQSTYPAAAVQQPYGQPAPAAPYGPPLYGPPPFGYPPQPPKKKRTGLVVGSIIAAVVVGGLVVGALLLFGTKTLNTGDAEKQVSRIAQEQVGAQLTDLRCPADVEVHAGGTFTCTATVEGQDVSFTVTQKDDQGNVQITSDNTYFAVSDIEDEVSAQVLDQTGFTVDSSCDTGGKAVLVDAAGSQLSCTVTNTEDSSDTLDVTATINDDGTVSVEG